MSCLTEVYYITDGARVVTPVGTPLPPFGKSLGKMSAVDWSQIVERGIVQFGM